MDYGEADGKLNWLKARRNEHENLIEEIQWVLNPWRGDITTEREGEERVGAVFDPSPAIALDTMVNYTVGAIFPPSGDWLKLMPTTKDTNRDKGTLEALDEAEQEILETLDNSNFYVEMARALKDMVGIGNCSVDVKTLEPFMDGDRVSVRLEFEAVPFNRYYRKLDSAGRAVLMAKKSRITGYEAREFFEAEGWEPSGALNDDYRFCYLIEKEKDGTYSSYWWEESVPRFIRETKGLPEPDITFAMWDQVDGEDYGVGRGHMVRGTVYGMQEMAAQLIQAASRDLNPMMTVEHDSVMRVEQGMNARAVLRPGVTSRPEFMQSGSNLQAVNEVRQQDSRWVGIAFLADLLLEPDTQPRSAEESRQREIRLFRRLSGPAQIIQHNLLAPVVMSVIRRMREVGGLLSLEGVDSRYGVTFASPFFTLQKAQQVQKVTDFVGYMAELGNVLQDPGIMDNINKDRMVEYIGLNSDVPKEIIQDKESMNEIRTARSESAAEEIALQRAAQAAQIPGATGPEPTVPGQI